MQQRLRVLVHQRLRRSPEAHRGRQYGRVSLPLVAVLLLGLALLVRIGVPLWAALAPEPVTSPADAAPGRPAGDYPPDLARLQALGLFASTPTPAAATHAAPPAVNTALNLRLEGVVLAGEPGNSRALIVSNAQQGSYRVGDTLPAGAGVLLDSIARDHVVINNRGQREALWLFPARPEAAPAPGGGLAPGTAPASGLALAGMPVDQRMLKTAATLAEILTVAPAQQNGQLIGYRLSPGAKLKEFVQLGFRENDIVTRVNGIALNDMNNVPQLYSLMNGATEVSFSLLREGAPLTLNVALSPELAR